MKKDHTTQLENRNLERALEWFLSFISEKAWTSRKANIELKLSKPTSAKPSTSLSEMRKLAIYDDRIGWYLYLAKTFLKDAPRYEQVQGARVIPIFYRIGHDLEAVKKIEGIDAKVKKMMKGNNTLADATLFEIIVALAWVKNGWSVAFIPEAPPDKTPDFIAKRGEEVWYVECKRLSQMAEYSVNEREKWLKMLNFIKENLVELNIVLDVCFHQELKSLPDTFLLDTLVNKLALIPPRMIATIIDNSVCTVKVSPIDIPSINKYLASNLVKDGSPQLIELIGGKRADSSGFTCGSMARPKEIGGQVYLEDIHSAFGAHWECDAPAAIRAKARNISRHLSDATAQLPTKGNSAIHIGIETFDGVHVEKERFDRIFNTVTSWNSAGKNIRWIYCHFFQSYVPPDRNWVIDETLSWFSSDIDRKHEPLENRFLIVPEEVGIEDQVHWNRPRP